MVAAAIQRSQTAPGKESSQALAGHQDKHIYNKDHFRVRIRTERQSALFAVPCIWNDPHFATSIQHSSKVQKCLCIYQDFNKTRVFLALDYFFFSFSFSSKLGVLNLSYVKYLPMEKPSCIQ